MFEKLVANYPRRTDLWSCYADQLVRNVLVEFQNGNSLNRPYFVYSQSAMCRFCNALELCFEI